MHRSKAEQFDWTTDTLHPMWKLVAGGNTLPHLASSIYFG